MAQRDNLAYDLSVYEPRQKQVEQPKEKKPSIQVNRNPAPVQRRTGALSMFLKMIVALVMLFAILFGRMESDRLFGQIHDLQNELKELQSENITLAAEYESRTSLKNVEDYAENVLGLKKLDKAQIEYVELPSDSVIEVVETERKNIFIIIRNKISEIKEYLGA